MCDANIPKGSTRTPTWTTIPATPGGYLGECTTGGPGTCTCTYSSNETGTDTVRVFFDRNLDDLKAGGAVQGRHPHVDV